MLKEFKVGLITPLTGAASAPALRILADGSQRCLHELDITRLNASRDDGLTICCGAQGQLLGAAQCSRNSATTAWLSWLAVADGASATPVLDTLLGALAQRLRARRVNELWAVVQPLEWISPYWTDLGFVRVNRLTTMHAPRERLTLPGARAGGGASFEPASVSHLANMQRVDHAAFAAHWQYSVSMLRDLIATSDSNFVALVDGDVAGYVSAVVDSAHAHVTRIAVDPAFAQRGLGAALLKQVALGLQPSASITLNTPDDAEPARRLYRKLGFEPTSDPLFVMRCPL